MTGVANKELNEKQLKFLEVLFNEAGGNPVKARQLAGYSEGYGTKKIMDSLKAEVIEATQLYIAMHAPKAAMAIIAGIDDPTELGTKEKINAAKDLLDRAGLGKTDKVQIESTGGIMLLPPKDVNRDDDE
jgi:hypothetical protein